MSAPEFTWSSDALPTGDIVLRTLKSQFGDGYAQVTQDGINNVVSTWPLSFTGTEAKIVAIRDFLVALGGASPLQWTPPLGVPALFLAGKFSLQKMGGIYRLTVTFEEFFEP